MNKDIKEDGYGNEGYHNHYPPFFNIQQTATMLPFDNSQISEESPSDNSQHSDLQDLNHLRQLLPEAINRMDQYSIHEQVQGEGESSMGEQQQEMMIKIREQSHLILQLQEKLHYYRTECLRLIDESHARKEDLQQLEDSARHKHELCSQLQKKLEEEYLKVSHLQKEMKIKDNKIAQLDRIIDRNNQKKEREVSFRNVYNQELLSKELLAQQKLIIDLTAKNEKMVKINSFLQRQLALAEQKLVSLQIQIQQKMCSILVDNVSRLKENQVNFSKSMQNYSLAHTNSISKVNFAHSNRPCIEETKTIKLQNSQEVGLPKDFPSDFDTLQKQPYRYDYKLKPVQSPKPQRKTNRVFSYHHKKREERTHHF